MPADEVSQFPPQDQRLVILVSKPLKMLLTYVAASRGMSVSQLVRVSAAARLSQEMGREEYDRLYSDFLGRNNG